VRTMLYSLHRDGINTTITRRTSNTRNLYYIPRAVDTRIYLFYLFIYCVMCIKLISEKKAKIK